jgi:hypothetical protein
MLILIGTEIRHRHASRTELDLFHVALHWLCQADAPVNSTLGMPFHCLISLFIAYMSRPVSHLILYYESLLDG